LDDPKRATRVKEKKDGMKDEMSGNGVDELIFYYLARPYSPSHMYSVARRRQDA
jgi:asparagine synthetase B (glutamine-hydrolysing)